MTNHYRNLSYFWKNASKLVPFNSNLNRKTKQERCQLKLRQSNMWVIWAMCTALVPENTIRNSEQATGQNKRLATAKGWLQIYKMGSSIHLLAPILLLDRAQNLFAPIVLSRSSNIQPFHSQPTHVITVAMLLHRTI